MNKITRIIKGPLNVAQDLTTKKVIKQFTHKFDLVYFGFVDHQEDDHQLIRGVTSSVSHIDNHYSVGHFQGHDVTLVERQNTLKFPGKQPKTYRWVIMQFDLHRNQLPHIFIDGQRHEEIFYSNFFAMFPHFENISSVFLQRDPLFAKHFKTFAQAHQFEAAQELLTHDITSMLAHHFKQFDYEIEDDHILIYASNPQVITMSILQEMLRIGSWLATQLNANK